MPRGGTDDAELEAPFRDELDDHARVVHLERDPHRGVRALELAEKLRHDDGGRAGRGADATAIPARSPSPSAATSSSTCCSSASSRCAPRNRRAPASVGSTRRPERSRSWAPRRFSSARTWSETAGWVTPSCSAACENERRSTTAQNAASWRVSISECYRSAMRVWIDVTNSPHVVFFRPLVALLEARGHDVTITARDFAQTLELLEDAGLEHTVVGPPHAGASRAGKVRAMASRLRALRRFARAARLRRRAFPRIPRAAARGAVARRALLVRIRLRVRAARSTASAAGPRPGSSFPR